MDDWDREALYDTEIAPLLARIHELCIIHDLPLLATVQFSLTGETAGLATVEHFTARGVARDLGVAAAILRGDAKAIARQLLVQPDGKGYPV